MAQLNGRTRAQHENEVAVAFSLHCAGMTQRAIALKMTADGMPISDTTVWRRIEEGIALYVIPALEEARTIELARLDSYLERLEEIISHGNDAISVNAIGKFLAVADRRARMMGLDQPARSELTIRQDQPSAVMAIIAGAKRRQQAELN